MDDRGMDRVVWRSGETSMKGWKMDKAINCYSLS